MLCAQCESRELYEPSDYFQKLWRLYKLQQGGYPFGQNDLTVEEWEDLGILRAEMSLPPTEDKK